MKFALLALVALAPAARAFEGGHLYDGLTLAETPLAAVARRAEAGSITVLSEIHDLRSHHDNEVAFLEALCTDCSGTNVGMEFFDWTQQASVNSYLRNEVSEGDFLKTVGWGSLPFDLYRRQVLFGLQHGGWTWGLNAPRTLSGHVARAGLAALSEDEKKLLPPDFTLGNDLYRERFAESMGGHVSPEQLANYFAAQSLWDETMSWQALKIQQNYPQRMVIIVGDFHNAYGGGLPDRLRARGARQLMTISQVNIKGLSADEVQALVSPHARYGKRADYVWISAE